MTWRDQRMLFTALGFLAVTMKDGNTESADLAYRARAMAALMEEFCRDNVQPGAVTLDMDSAIAVSAVDQMILHYVRELREREETVLPEDRETLLRLYDRLQHRAIRREQAEFYSNAHVQIVADRVLAYLDAEIAQRESDEQKAWG